MTFNRHAALTELDLRSNALQMRVYSTIDRFRRSQEASRASHEKLKERVMELVENSREGSLKNDSSIGNESFRTDYEVEELSMSEKEDVNGDLDETVVVHFDPENTKTYEDKNGHAENY